MAAIAESAVGGAASPRARGRRRTGSSASTVWRWVVLLIAGVYFLVPLAVALRFAGIKAFGSVVSETGFTSSLGLSVRLAIVTTVITIVLMLPTTVYVHLRLPGIRRLMEGITILPIVIPPVVLIVGVLAIAPGFAEEHGVPALAGVRGAGHAVRLPGHRRRPALARPEDASSRRPARWAARSATTLWRVILPNLRTALLSATVLTVALVLGEYTMASLALYQTFPVWIYVNSQTSGQVSVAASLLALFVTWFFLMIITVLGTPAVAPDAAAARSRCSPSHVRNPATPGRAA